MKPSELEQINASVASAIQIHVNGKIDRIAKHLVEQDANLNSLKEDFRAHASRIEPVIKQFEERAGFKSTIYGFGKSVGLVSGIIAGLTVIIVFLVKLVRSVNP